MKGYSVFNVAQVDGYTGEAQTTTSVPNQIEVAEEFLRHISATVRHGGDRTYYAPELDYIQMPPFEAFKDNIAYYSTLAHEHTHWTWKPGRCDRQLDKRFGSNAYAAEGLIAELGAAFVCAHLGLGTEARQDHAQYIQHWLMVMRTDERVLWAF